MKKKIFTGSSTIRDVVSDEAFEDFGRLLFPADLRLDDAMTLDEISSSRVYIWYSDIRPEKTVEVVNCLRDEAADGRRIFYPLYSQEEIMRDPSRADVGLFFFRGRPGSRFAIVNAGGGFMYVAAMQDSFPQALEISRNGLNAFALIYRVSAPFEDLARAISFVYDNADELGVDPYGYSLWGGSAGARMAAGLGRKSALRQLTGRKEIPQAAAVITQYTGYDSVSPDDAPSYINVGDRDGIAYWRTMRARAERLERVGIPSEFHVYRGLTHGFGLGTGTEAEGWVKEALGFWEKQVRNRQQ